MDSYQPDHYRLLGVSLHAEPEEIKNNYRKLSRIYHPDAQGGSDTAEDCFKQISAAYTDLADVGRRQHYDRMLMVKDPLRMVDDPRAERALDVLDRVVARVRRKQAALPSVPTGRDLRVKQSIPFAIAVLGGKVAVRASYPTPCGTCLGAATLMPDRVPVCHVCAGQGTLRVGLRRTEQACGFCHGKGQITLRPCASCRGSGQGTTERVVEVQLPARMTQGAVVRVRGAGEPGQGAQTGDLVVVVDILSDPLLRCEKDDLVVDVPLTWHQAAAGARILVPTLEGLEQLTVPPASSSGREFRIADRGLPLQGRAGRGALRVRLVVDVPSTLTRDQLQLLHNLEQAAGGRQAYSRVQAFERALAQMPAAPKKS